MLMYFYRGGAGCGVFISLVTISRLEGKCSNDQLFAFYLRNFVIPLAYLSILIRLATEST